MAKDLHEYQIIIVGGGISGLTLALMCQLYKIDYVLLEAYGSVTPQVGASIGLFCNGLRVLDQLGLYDKILAVGAPVSEAFHVVAETGKLVMDRKDRDLLVERHGYSPVFMERYELLKVMEADIVDKERLVVNKKVVRVDNLEDFARVYTADGAEYRGQLVVGADGIKSTVRKEMWRTADEQAPGSIPEQDRGDIACEHACIFGTAHMKERFAGCRPGETVTAMGPDTIAGTLGGPGDDVFLFWFWRERGGRGAYPVDELPTYTEADKQREMARAHEHFLNENGDRFGAVLDQLVYSVITPLPHYCMRRWQHRRILILGDAAHKFNPVGGMGGNSCIESCASLANKLHEYFGSDLSSVRSWPLPTLTKALASVEKQRVGRVSRLVELGQQVMRLNAWETTALKLAAKYVVPNLSHERLVSLASDQIHDMVSLKYGDFKTVPHSWPYADEKEVKRKSAKGTTTTTVSALIPFVALATVLLSKTGRGHAENVASTVFSWFTRV